MMLLYTQELWYKMYAHEPMNGDDIENITQKFMDVLKQLNGD